MPCTDGVVGRLVDEDEAPGGAVAPVLVHEQRRRQAQPQPADLVQLEPVGLLLAVERVHVDAVQQLVHLGERRARGVLDPVAAGGRERALRHPAHHRVDVARLDGLVVRTADHVAARHVDVVLEAQRDRQRRVGLLELALEGVDRRDARGPARGQHDDLVARAEHPRGHLAGVAAVVVVLVRHRPHDPLHGEARVLQVAVGGHVHVLEVVEQRGPLVPGHPLRALDHVVAVQRGDRDEGDVVDVELGRPARELGADAVEHLLVEGDQVHLVHAHDEVRDAQERGDERVPARLLEHALARVDEDQRQVGGRGAGDHVARVLLVARRVGDDELAPRGVEVAVGDVDRDALLALGPQAVGEQRQVDVAVAAPERGLLHVLELVLEDRLRVEEEAADEGGLAVVDRARGGEADELGGAGDRSPVGRRARHGRSSPPSCGPPWRPPRSGRRRASRRAR